MNGSFATGWRQVGACLVLMATIAMMTTTYSILAVPLDAEFHPSRMVLMLAMTVLALSTGVVAPVLGSLMDRVSMRLMMAAGAACMVAGYLALSFASSFAQVLVVYGLLLGPVQVLLGPMAATVLLSRWFVGKRGRALGIAITGVALGGFVFPPIVQGLLGHFDWRTAMRLLALILFACTVPAVLLIVNRPEDKGLHADGAASPPPVVEHAAAGQAISTGWIVSDPAFWLSGLLYALVMSGMLGMVTNLMPLATDTGIEAGTAALLISVYAAGGFGAKLTFAAIGDRVSPRTIMYISLTGFALGMACMVGAELGLAMIALGVALIGYFGGFMVPMQSYLTPRIFGENVVGRAAGLQQIIVLVAMLTTPPMFGLIFDVNHSYDTIFMAFAAMAGIMMLIVPHIRLHPRPAPAPPVPA